MTPEKRSASELEFIESHVNQYGLNKERSLLLIARVKRLEAALQSYHCGQSNCPHEICKVARKVLEDEVDTEGTDTEEDT